MVGGFIGIWERKMGFISLYSETSQWELSSWPTVPNADRPTAIWAVLDQSRIPNLHLEVVLYPWFIHLLICLFIYPFHLPIRSFNTFVLDFELSSFDKE